MIGLQNIKNNQLVENKRFANFKLLFDRYLSEGISMSNEWIEKSFKLVDSSIILSWMVKFVLLCKID